MFINETQAADRIDVNVRTLRNWRTRGGGPPFYKVGRLVRYDEEEVIAWVRARRALSTTQADHSRVVTRGLFCLIIIVATGWGVNRALPLVFSQTPVIASTVSLNP